MKNMILITLFAAAAFAAPSRKEFSEAFIDVAAKANPAVVSIVSEKVMENDFHRFFLNPWFEDFGPREYKGESLGSGVIVDARKGYIVTNFHVVEDADEVKVQLLNNGEIEAVVIGTDPLSDLAVLQVEADDLTAVRMGDSDELEIGEWVIAIGSPFQLNLNHTVTAGIVSAKGRSDVISRVNFENFIQHDAAINPGNSGGALLNLDGELVGINSAIATDGFSRANAGVGFAIPINQVKRVVRDLIEHGSVARGWLGVSIQDIDQPMAKALNLGSRNGAIISQVLNDSPASESDIREQDIILQVNDIKIESASHLRNSVAALSPGDKVKFRVLRDDREKVITVVLGTRPDEEDLQLAMQRNGYSGFDVLGLKVENLNGETYGRYHYDGNGVIVAEVEDDSPAEDAQIRPGDVIVKIGKTSITSEREYLEELEKYETGDSVLLLIKTDNSSRFVALEIE